MICVLSTIYFLGTRVLLLARDDGAPLGAQCGRGGRPRTPAPQPSPTREWGSASRSGHVIIVGVGERVRDRH